MSGEVYKSKINRDLVWWSFALVFFLAGDLITTYIGLKHGIGKEKNPIMLFILGEGGGIAVIGFKTLIVVSLQLLWGVGWYFTASRDIQLYPTITPRLVALIGLILTLNNIYIIHTMGNSGLIL